MTEDESKTKNCPLFSSAAMLVFFGCVERGYVAEGARDILEKARKCQGSACMMWQSVHQPALTGELKRDASSGDYVPEKAPKSGYCGLAGKQ